MRMQQDIMMAWWGCNKIGYDDMMRMQQDIMMTWWGCEDATRYYDGMMRMQ